jgi:hypothetical protein
MIQAILFAAAYPALWFLGVCFVSWGWPDPGSWEVFDRAFFLMLFGIGGVYWGFMTMGIWDSYGDDE